MKVYTGWMEDGGRYRELGLCTVSIERTESIHFRPDYKLVELCPTSDLGTIKFNATIYNMCIIEKTTVMNIMRRLKEIARGRDVILLGHQKHQHNCHRMYVANWLKDFDMDVQEYYLPTLYGSDQLNLF